MKPDAFCFNSASLDMRISEKSLAVETIIMQGDAIKLFHRRKKLDSPIESGNDVLCFESGNDIVFQVVILRRDRRIQICMDWNQPTRLRDAPRNSMTSELSSVISEGRVLVRGIKCRRDVFRISISLPHQSYAQFQ